MNLHTERNNSLERWARMKRHGGILKAVCPVVFAVLGGCASIVAPAPRIVAIVVPPMPAPEGAIPPAPQDLVIRPLFTDIAGHSDRRPQVTAPPPKGKDGPSSSPNGDRRASGATMAI